MRVLAEAAKVLAVGALLGLAVGLVRGFPGLAASEDASAVCLPPVAAQPRVAWIPPEQARELLSDASVVFVDARSTDEFHAGHIAGALSVPMDTGTLPPDVEGLLRGMRTIISYCDTSDDCAASARLATLLAEAGFADVRVLEGGMPAWLERGYAAEAGSCQRCP